MVAQEIEALGMAPLRGHSHTFDAAVLEREVLEYETADALLDPLGVLPGGRLERGAPSEKPCRTADGFDAGRLRFRQRAQAGGRLFTAIFSGRCEPAEGSAPRAARRPDSGACEGGRFIILGSFAPGYREAIEPLLAHPSVEVHGFVSDPSELMRESDVFVFPSIEEGSALVTYEAQACGCVPVISEATGARCRDGVDGYVHAPGDVADAHRAS